MIAVRVKTSNDKRADEPAWEGDNTLGGIFGNLGEGADFLKFLEERGETAYVQLGYVGRTGAVDER